MMPDITHDNIRDIVKVLRYYHDSEIISVFVDNTDIVDVINFRR